LAIRAAVYDGVRRRHWVGPAAAAATADLVARLEDDEGNVRLAAADALPEIAARPPAVLPALERALKDADSRVDARLVLEKLARDPDPAQASAR
jgi:HEAT repeat protein